jgi:hypothetical protein
MTFREAFRVTQDALGLTHYSVAFDNLDEDGIFARISTEADECIANCRVNHALVDAHSSQETVAVHECIHMLLADLLHAVDHCPQIRDVEEERLVRRLEPLIHRALFPPNPTIRKSLE